MMQDEIKIDPSKIYAPTGTAYMRYRCRSCGISYTDSRQQLAIPPEDNLYRSFSIASTDYDCIKPGRHHCGGMVMGIADFAGIEFAPARTDE